MTSRAGPGRRNARLARTGISIHRKRMALHPGSRPAARALRTVRASRLKSANVWCTEANALRLRRVSAINRITGSTPPSRHLSATRRSTAGGHRAPSRPRRQSTGRRSGSRHPRLDGRHRSGVAPRCATQRSGASAPGTAREVVADRHPGSDRRPGKPGTGSPARQRRPCGRIRESSSDVARIRPAPPWFETFRSADRPPRGSGRRRAGRVQCRRGPGLRPRWRLVLPDGSGCLGSSSKRIVRPGPSLPVRCASRARYVG
jgi:hypothetical protein